jgi:hypothetical protein
MKPTVSSSFFTETKVLWLLGLALFLLHLFTNHQYELVILDNANNLDWGFVEYPPLTPFLARMEDVSSVSAQCQVAGTITNPYGVENDLRNPPDIFVCRELRISWPEFWNRVKRYS